ncbi:MAG: flagellar basal-body rod protein FlgG [Thermoleophilaceae bacterium]|jgi:flagellar basal-body rod protein FlgG|nr:flagellar basal-body rod protein FlgG [Thermoleophilaceae bacterium]
MIQGLGAALSALTAQGQRMDALANDTANLNTTGYRAARLALTERSAGVAAVDLGRSDAQGALIATGEPLDLAVEGDGWFQVQRADGSHALTRAGAFQVDASGRIVTGTGEPLVPPIGLPPGADPSSIAIASDGTVSAAGVWVGRIQLFDGHGTPLPASSSNIRQGALEASDVDLAETVVGTIEARTSYKAAIEALHVQDEMWASLLELRR